MHIKIVQADSSIKNISEFFNRKFLESPRSDVYGFLTEDDRFVDQTNAIELIAKEFQNNAVGVVYSDKFLEKDNKLLHQIFPAYSEGDSSVFNPIIFVTGKVSGQLFNPQLNHLRSYDVIQKLGQLSQVVHIPEPLFISQFSCTDISEELKIYVGQSN